jgi:hypothetical protein
VLQSRATRISTAQPHEGAAPTNTLPARSPPWITSATDDHRGAYPPQVLLQPYHTKILNLPDRGLEEGPIQHPLVSRTDICFSSILAPSATILLLLPVDALASCRTLRDLPHFGAQYPLKTNIFYDFCCLASQLAAASRYSPTSATAYAPRFKALGVAGKPPNDLHFTLRTLLPR